MELDYKLPFSMTQVILHGKLYGDNFSDIQRYLIGIHGHFSTHRVTSTRRKKIKKEERGSGEEGERFFFFFQIFPSITSCSHRLIPLSSADLFK